MKERAPGANPSSNRLVRVVPRRMKERAPGSRSRWDEMSWGKEIDEAVAMAKAPLRDYVAWLLHVAAPPYGQLSAGERHKVHEANIGSLPR